MVIDILDALASPVVYDEFIVASSDTDFTPLLQRLRATDRRTMIMACGPSASAFRNVADMSLDAEAIVSLLVANDDVADSPVDSEAGTDVVESSKWFGRTALSKFIDTYLPDIAVHEQRTWNPAQHAVPENLAPASNRA